ncbi:hypothetical protein MW7_001985 [Imbroritus primus]|uniref:Uncharacterized protein n=2 Tax=Imbroritus primus TaxID=3058603 RepID=A0ACD3SSY8_9BURK|nr:hypothetical protein MW7_015275 [Burkholderiaceae bacterium PBA]TMS59399.1 hypothetical protein MW7_001985 [Burkholderiaceae bacterium PBA]
MKITKNLLSVIGHNRNSSTTGDVPISAPQASARATKNLSSQPPSNLISQLPGDVQKLIFQNLDFTSQYSLAVTEKARLNFFSNSIAREFDNIMRKIYIKSETFKSSRKYFPDHNKISAESELFEWILDDIKKFGIPSNKLSFIDKQLLTQFFHKEVFDPSFKKRTIASQEYSVSIITHSIAHNHFSIKASNQHFSEESRTAATQLLSEFSRKFDVDNSKSITQENVSKFIKSLMRSSAWPLFIAKLSSQDERVQRALVNFLAWIIDFSRSNYLTHLTKHTDRKTKLQVLNIVEKMLHAAAPLADRLHHHRLSQSVHGSKYGYETRGVHTFLQRRIHTEFKLVAKN